MLVTWFTRSGRHGKVRVLFMMKFGDQMCRLRMASEICATVLEVDRHANAIFMQTFSTCESLL
jgi:hypothetical protein